MSATHRRLVLLAALSVFGLSALAAPLPAAPPMPPAPPAAPAAPAPPAPPEQLPEGKIYAPGQFDRLEIDGSGQIRLVQADRDEVFVAGGEQAQQGVEIHLSGSRLKVELSGGWKFWSGSKAQVEVRMRNLSRITLSGAGDVMAPGPIRSPSLGIDIAGSGTVRFDDLVANQVRFEISGAGEGQLTGQVQSLNLSVSGKGKVTADQLRVSTASVSISGVANAELWVTDQLRVDISGAGHVGYWGQPKERQSISGLGTVDSRGDKH
jgi:hypothetical protein